MACRVVIQSIVSRIFSELLQRARINFVLSVCVIKPYHQSKFKSVRWQRHCSSAKLYRVRSV
jgi:hypothetical protein